MHATPTTFDSQIADLVLQARGLAAVRNLLAVRGATDDELDAHTRELERVKSRLVARLT